MRASVTALLVLIIMAAAFFWLTSQVQLSPPANTRSRGQLIITNLPGRLCPSSARLVITGPDIAPVDRSFAVTDCHHIDITTILANRTGPVKITALISQALNEQITIQAPLTGSVDLPVRLGDLNNDNSIDSTDQKIVEENMTLKDPLKTADLNNDQQVNVLDAAIVSLNQGVGAEL